MGPLSRPSQIQIQSFFISFAAFCFQFLVFPSSALLALSAMTAVTALLLNVITQPAQDLWPAFVCFASSWGQTGVGYAYGGDSSFFVEFKADKGFRAAFFPAWDPGEFEKSWAVDLSIFAGHTEIMSLANTFHQPFAADARIGFYVS